MELKQLTENYMLWRKLTLWIGIAILIISIGCMIYLIKNIEYVKTFSGPCGVCEALTNSVCREGIRWDFLNSS